LWPLEWFCAVTICYCPSMKVFGALSVAETVPIAKNSSTMIIVVFLIIFTPMNVIILHVISPSKDRVLHTMGMGWC